MSIFLEKAANYIKREINAYDHRGKCIFYRGAWTISILIIGIHLYALAFVMFFVRPITTMRTLYEFTGKNRLKKMAEQLEEEVKKVGM